MQRRPFVFALGVVLMMGGGCQLPQNHPAAVAPKTEQVRASCYSLLHDLLSQQKNVDKLLMIKLESKELNRLTLLDIEELSERELDQIKSEYERLAREARKSLRCGKSDLGLPAVNAVSFSCSK